jgi:hypothetical protein
MSPTDAGRKQAHRRTWLVVVAVGSLCAGRTSALQTLATGTSAARASPPSTTCWRGCSAGLVAFPQSISKQYAGTTSSSSGGSLQASRGTDLVEDR